MIGVVLEQSSRADHSSEHIAIRDFFAETPCECEMTVLA